MKNPPMPPSMASPSAARIGASPRRAGSAGLGGKVAASERPITSSITRSSEISPALKPPTIRPLRRIVRLSQKSRTSCIRCEMKTIVVPSARSRSKSAPSHCTSLPESDEVGSSSRSRRGLRETARAISIFCRVGSASVLTSAWGSISSRPRSREGAPHLPLRLAPPDESRWGRSAHRAATCSARR